MVVIYLIAGGSRFEDSKPDLLLVSLAVIQISVSAIVLLIVLLYSSRAWSSEGVQKATAAFFEEDLVSALQKVSFYEAPPDLRHSLVEIENSVDIFGSVFTLKSYSHTLRVWIGLNVNRIFVIYWVENSEAMSLREIEGIFKFTFGGAEKLGYGINYEEASIPFQDGTHREIISIWSTVKVDDSEFLATPSSRRFWAQDIAMMTESFWRTALRNNIQLSQERPAPL
ncbi:MAG: hypothetical protein ACOY95_01510 [Pseudomonadota bacterium]